MTVTVTLAVEPTASAPALLLRRWVAADLPALLAAHADPAMRRFLSATVEDEAAAERWLADQDAGWDAGTRYSFAVLEAVDEVELVGLVVVRRVRAEDTSAEVGCWTVAGARGRGIAPRSLDALADWAFAATSVRSLDLFHAADNHASCRVADKAGFPLRSAVPAQPPEFPQQGHLHVRDAD